MLKKGMVLILILVMVLSLAACSSSGNGGETSGEADTQQEQYVMKIAHAAMPGSARHQGAEKIKEVVESETEGQVKVEIYPASQLGSGREQIEGMQAGTIEMVILPSAFLGGFEPLVTALDLPFFYPDEVDKLLELEKSDAMKMLLSKTEDEGIKCLALWHTGYRQFTSKPRPLTSPEAFKGLKFRSMPSPIQVKMYEVYGGTPITMPFSETYSALQTGAIDGQDNPITTNYDMKFYEVQKYMTLTRHGLLDQVIMVGKDWFEDLPENIQNAIIKGVQEGQEVCLSRIKENEAKYLKAMKDSGLEVIELTDEQRTAFVEASAQVKQFYIEKYGDEAEEIIKALEEEIGK